MNRSVPANHFLAHSANCDGRGVVERLNVHLLEVAQRAAEYAAAFDAREQGFAAGLLHDLGKYSKQFLRRLEPGSREPGRDHWSLGAAVCAKAYKKRGAIPALAIAGHHVGLQRLESAGETQRCIGTRMLAEPDLFTETDFRAVQERFFADRFVWPSVKSGLTLKDQPAADMLDVRMLFSALVDADFVETEAHFNGDATTHRRYRMDGPTLNFDRAIEIVERHVAGLRQPNHSTPIQKVRDQLYESCVAMAVGKSTGLFTLAAPTGAGKTLAMLAFALHHARKHGLRRIVLVMPFLNIIEQTAGIYRLLFNAGNGFDQHAVVEHHSLTNEAANDPHDGRRDGVRAIARLLAENWDAPIVLTTSVQCLESMMANRPSRCRKLHRLARSVILFDEVQTLPPKLAVATLATLARLADPHGPFGSTVLFATATQPAFGELHDRVTKLNAIGWRSTEIAPESGPMFSIAAHRVHVTWRHTTPLALNELADELENHERALCIVNLKRHAVELATTLRDRGVNGVLHISTNMCPQHRSGVLAKVAKRLNAGRPLRLIATQCVEAGVDLDFPVVYRALAPLEAIAQAAGRCNRHGRNARGKVVVFKPLDERGIYPPGYREAVQATESFLAGLMHGGIDLNTTEIINSPARLQAYFRHFYQLSGRSTTVRDDERELHRAIEAGNFERVAELYQLIPQNTINVLVPFDKATFEDLATDIRSCDPLTPEFIRQWIRRATPHAVGIYRPPDASSLWNHLLPVQFSRHEPALVNDTNWFIAGELFQYDEFLGVAKTEYENSWIA